MKRIKLTTLGAATYELSRRCAHCNQHPEPPERVAMLRDPLMTRRTYWGHERCMRKLSDQLARARQLNKEREANREQAKAARIHS